MLALMCVAAVLTAQSPPPLDPAQPPPLLEPLDAPPVDAPPVATPPPIDAPEATPTPTLPKPIAPNPPPAKDAPAHKNDDLLMLLADYALFFAPIPGAALVVPIAQGGVHYLAGDLIAKNKYPNWWVGTLAGYGVYAVSTVMIVGGYGVLVFGVLSSVNTNNPGAAFGAAVGGGALMLAGAAATFTEPLVVWWVAGFGATAIDDKKAGAMASAVDEDPQAGAPFTWRAVGF